MKKLLLFLIYFLTSVLVYSQTTFFNAYDTHFGESAVSITKTIDGNILLLGNTYPHGSDVGSLFIMKINLFGDTIWTKTYSNSFQLLAAECQTTNDGGFIVAGNVRNTLNQNFLLLRADSMGNIIWVRQYSFYSIQDYCKSVKITPDGGFIFLGYVFNEFDSDSTYHKLAVFKTNSVGDILWCKEVQIHRSMTLPGEIVNSDSNRISLVGYNFNNGVTKSALLVVFDLNGTLVWSKAYCGPWGSFGFACSNTIDGGYIITGQTYYEEYTNHFSDRIYLLKVDHSGNIQWSKKFGNAANSVGWDVIEAQDKGYAITGYSSEYLGGNLVMDNIILIKTDSNGIIQWGKYYGGNSNSDDRAFCLMQNEDQGFLVAGVSSDNNTDAFLLKTDSLGNTDCNGYNLNFHDSLYSSTFYLPALQISNLPTIDISTTLVQTNISYSKVDPCSYKVNDIIMEREIIIVYPNPTNGKLNIQIPQHFVQTKTLEIYNCIGQLQSVQTDRFTEMDISNLTSGLYFLMLTNIDNERQTIKIIKE
jgi:hypothetical protein